MNILYLTSRADASVNGVYIKGLRENGAEVVVHGSDSRGLRKLFEIWKAYRQHRKQSDLIVVGIGTPDLAVWMRLISRKKIVYNALCSNYERMVISRNLAPRFSPKAFYYWVEDFLACGAANMVMVESQHQADFFHRLFKVSKPKLVCAYTGVDEDDFFFDPQIVRVPEFTVIFRGRLLPESGVGVAVRAAKILENQGVKFIIVGAGQNLPAIERLIRELHSKNVQLITERLPVAELRRLMQSAHLSLGQLSSHPRLERTIPHKAYESIVMKTPYLTARNPGVLELLRENEACLACNPADAEDLAEKILWAKDHPEELQRIVENAYRLYQEQLTPEILAGKLLKRFE